MQPEAYLPYTRAYEALCSGLRSYLPASVAVVSGERYRLYDTTRKPTVPSVTVVIDDVRTDAVELGSNAWRVSVLFFLLAASPTQQAALKTYVSTWAEHFETVVEPSPSVYRHLSGGYIHTTTDLPPVEVVSSSFWHSVIHTSFILA